MTEVGGRAIRSMGPRRQNLFGKKIKERDLHLSKKVMSGLERFIQGLRRGRLLSKAPVSLLLGPGSKRFSG